MGVEILRLEIRRFRGIESLDWLPRPGVNVIVGGGDVGKTSLLEAIALLLFPTNTFVLTDSDYYRRHVDAGFSIEAVMSLDGVEAVSQQRSMNWPWRWDGRAAVTSACDEEAAATDSKAVYRVNVRGTSDLDLEYEMIQPDESVTAFSVGLRREIGLVRIVGDERSDRDLRLLRGSALDRLLNDPGLRGRLGVKLASRDLRDDLSNDSRSALDSLSEVFGEKALPGDLGVAVTGGPGASLNALLGLTAQLGETRLPFMSWGAGTRRLGALTIASALQGEAPITVIDEVERGLEPYRQRRFAQALLEGRSQSFVTTHSPAFVTGATGGTLWYMDRGGRLGVLDPEKVSHHQRSDPEAFLSKLTVVSEGATEFGFVTHLLRLALPQSLQHGVWMTDAGGHDNAATLVQAFAEAGISVAAMVDDEGRLAGTWRSLKERLADLLIQWRGGCLEAAVLPLFSAERLNDLIADPDGEYTGARLRSLADRLGIESKTFEDISEAAGDRLHALIVEAATGKVPDDLADAPKGVQGPFKGHGKVWFKSRRGGEELAQKVMNLGVWRSLKDVLLPFLNAIRVAAGKAPIEDLTIDPG